MKVIAVAVIIILSCIACQSDTEASATEDRESNEVNFDKEKWLIKEGKDYPYRAEMLNDIVYNDSLRTLSGDQVINLLGEPDRRSEKHLYYLVSQKRLGSWPLHSRTLVIKLTDDSKVDWIKIHE